MNEKPKIGLVVDNTEEEVMPATKPDSTQPPPRDWLSPMKPWTRFKCRDKTGRLYPRFLVLDYLHGGLLKGDVWLIPTATENDVKTWTWVDPKEWCQLFEFRGTIEEPDSE